VFSNISVHFYKYICLNGQCHLTRDLVSAHSSNFDPIQETEWVLFCKTMVHHIHYMLLMGGNGVSNINKHKGWWADYVSVH